MKFRRTMFTDKNDNGLILTEAPDTVYRRVVVEEATWKTVDPLDVASWGYMFEVVGMKFLDHHEDGIRMMDASTASRATMLEWSTVPVLLAEVLDAPDGAPDGTLQGSMVWIIMDDLCEQDKINTWLMFFEHGVKLS